MHAPFELVPVTRLGLKAVRAVAAFWHLSWVFWLAVQLSSELSPCWKWVVGIGCALFVKEPQVGEDVDKLEGPVKPVPAAAVDEIECAPIASQKMHSTSGSPPLPCSTSLVTTTKLHSLLIGHGMVLGCSAADHRASGPVFDGLSAAAKLLTWPFGC